MLVMRICAYVVFLCLCCVRSLQWDKLDDWDSIRYVADVRNGVLHNAEAMLMTVAGMGWNVKSDLTRSAT
jgi:hypothetical protein